MSGEIYVSAILSLGKEPPVPIGQEVRWAPEMAWTLWRRRKLLASAGNRTPAVQLVACRCIDCAIPAAVMLISHLRVF
jgi:hypothetical protein